MVHARHRPAGGAGDGPGSTVTQVIGANYALGGYYLFAGVHRGYTPPSSGTLRVVNFGADTAGQEQCEDGGVNPKSHRFRLPAVRYHGVIQIM